MLFRSGVTIGALSTKEGQKLRGTRRHPTIEDEVTLYSGASILGGDTVIGKGSIIGGNAFITKSVAPYTTVTVKTSEKGETLFDIAKRFGIDIKHIKAVNPGLDNAPRAGVSITIPQMVNNENYLIHEVEHSQRTKALLRLWKVEEESFRVLNPFEIGRAHV